VTKKNSISTELARHALYRGIYTRVAKRLGVDRSYVSRVASGQRRSPEVEDALLKEIKRIEKAFSKR
jgi:transcriptional regulator with XRE-family HTH domain